MGRWFSSAIILFCGSCSVADPIIDYQIGRVAEKFSAMVPPSTGGISMTELIYGLITLAAAYMGRKGALKVFRK